jgi:hypothetical protein
MLDETQVIKAREVVDNPDDIRGFTRAFVMVTDTSMNYTFTNLMDAINIFYEYGWEVHEIETETNQMFVLFKNPDYKRKNRI